MKSLIGMSEAENVLFITEAPDAVGTCRCFKAEMSHAMSTHPLLSMMAALRVGGMREWNFDNKSWDAHGTALETWQTPPCC